MSTNNDPKAVQTPDGNTRWYVLAILATMLIGAVAIVILAVTPGVESEHQTIGVLIAFLAPTLGTLLATLKAGEAVAVSKQTHEKVNSRLTEMLSEVDKTAYARGFESGQAAASARAGYRPGDKP